ncbi:unnamed protein product, partial [Allacma fusca]
LEGDFPEV